MKQVHESSNNLNYKSSIECAFKQHNINYPSFMEERWPINVVASKEDYNQQATLLWVSNALALRSLNKIFEYIYLLDSTTTFGIRVKASENLDFLSKHRRYKENPQNLEDDLNSIISKISYASFVPARTGVNLRNILDHLAGFFEGKPNVVEPNFSSLIKFLSKQHENKLIDSYERNTKDAKPSLFIVAAK